MQKLAVLAKPDITTKPSLLLAQRLDGRTVTWGLSPIISPRWCDERVSQLFFRLTSEPPARVRSQMKKDLIRYFTRAYT